MSECQRGGPGAAGGADRRMDVEAGLPGGPPWPGAGRVSFEWLDGAPLLIERWHVDLPEAPDGVAVIGCDGMSDTYYQLYTDERDVQRVYAMSLDDGVWKLWRDGEPFSQRFTGTFSEDGNTIAGRWEISEDGDVEDGLRPDLRQGRMRDWSSSRRSPIPDAGSPATSSRCHPGRGSTRA